ncbi:hypothetical protein [Knoellia koreensis]|uniref:Uncharacterized protein n=1 Tax=Knoellia koreensis TaxID=2730921 RepID=A0A849HGI9_9MICO|nr:hypothetical protein [Knoellia sp. DB2414S]NNM46538.1 hypothetical protein [Knoellia sp. DB2414S]
MHFADASDGASLAQGWITVGLTIVLVVITAWTTYLNWRLTRSSETAAESAKLAAEASKSAALVAASTARVDFEIERDYVPRDVVVGDSIATLSYRASGTKKGQPGYDLHTIFVLPLDAAVYVHGAVLVRYGHRYKKSSSTESATEIPLVGPEAPTFVHAGESVAFGVPSLFDPGNAVDLVLMEESVDLVACRVTYSFDGVGPVRERMVANYDYDRGIDID